MKITYFIFLCLCTGNICHSQILKKVLNDAKNQAEWKVRSKATQKTDQAIDSLLAPQQKKEERKSTSKQTQVKQSTTGTSTTSSNEESSTIGEGFISLSLSATEVFRGGTVIVTGTSVKYGSLQNIVMTVKGPETDEKEDVKLYDNGSYAIGWDAEQAGEFTITVKSSDGKDQKSAKVKVYDIDVMDDLWVRDDEKLTHKTYDKLKAEAERVESLLAEKDKAELEQEMVRVKKNVDAVLKLYNDLANAAAGLGNIIKKGSSLSPNLYDNLSQLNDKLNEQQAQMQKMYDAANHEPYDNTVCEYLVMLNEACAAFSTFTNIWSKSVATILKNIVLDKATPKAVEVANDKAGANMGDLGAVDKTAGKLFATAQLDAEGLFGKLSTASFTGDIMQFATDGLMKKYCGVFKGELNHDYKITYRNSAGATWWAYSYKTESAVTFRYPKTNSGKIIKMKGNIEGNATEFKFFQDVEQMDDFKEQMKGRAKLTPIQLYKPLAVPFASSKKDELGFGAAARGIATPAYFNIPVDAEYDTEAETIKIFLNDPIIDFTPMVKYTYGYIAIAAGIPLVTRVDFPINKARLTLNAVVSRSNELTVSKDAKNNLTVKGSGDRHIGTSSSETEHEISYTVTAKNDN
ncbi:MAG TPA: hypothetical protein VFH07_08005 [Chitinophagaceae bacterium]|nr:hypothetical protein [Chitinophagaceae bacterium]